MIDEHDFTAESAPAGAMVRAAMRRAGRSEAEIAASLEARDITCADSIGQLSDDDAESVNAVIGPKLNQALNLIGNAIIEAESMDSREARALVGKLKTQKQGLETLVADFDKLAR